MTFAENLVKLHETYGIAYSFLAAKAGISTSLLSAYATGKNDPTISKALQIIKACPIDWEWEIDDCLIYSIERKETILCPVGDLKEAKTDSVNAN